MMWENVKQNKSGNYFGKCITCGCDFIGEKRDVSCDDCKTVQLSIDDYYGYKKNCEDIEEEK